MFNYKKIKNSGEYKYIESLMSCPTNVIHLVINDNEFEILFIT